MDRRTFIGAVTGGFLAAPVSVCAQKAPQMYRIGFLGTSTGLTTKLFWDAMRGLGWVEGQNVQGVSRQFVTWFVTPGERRPIRVRQV